MLHDQAFDIRSLHAAYAGGLDPAAVIDEAYRRVDAVGDPGIFLHLIARDAALAAVAGLGPFDPAAKPLWGIPFAVKDNIDAAGAPTTAACPVYAYTAERDAFVVETLRRKIKLITHSSPGVEQWAGALAQDWIQAESLEQAAGGLRLQQCWHGCRRNQS